MRDRALIASLLLLTCIGCGRAKAVPRTVARATSGALTKADVGSVISAAKPAFAACSPGYELTVTTKIEIRADGGVTILSMKPDRDPRVVACMRAVWEGLRFRPNDGRTPPITYPLILGP